MCNNFAIVSPVHLSLSSHYIPLQDLHANICLIVSLTSSVSAKEICRENPLESMFSFQTNKNLTI